VSFLTAFREAVYPTLPLARRLRGGGFGLPAALALMWLSQLAYEASADTAAAEGQRKQARVLRRWGFTRTARLSRGGTEGFVAESETALVVAFAGTDPVVAANWITDLDIRSTAGGTHRGFDDGVQGVWPDLAAALMASRKPVYLTGHSLGGALATLAAWRIVGRLHAEAGRIAGVVSFGAPRIGNETFVASYRGRGLWRKTVRLRYGDDIVPRVPPSARGPLGFHHVGLGLRCPHGGRFATGLPPRDEPAGAEREGEAAGWAGLQAAMARLADHGAPSFPGGEAARLFADTLPYFLRDHLQDRYLDALGWRFLRPAHPDMALDAGETGRFTQAVQARLRERVDSLSRLFGGVLTGRP
jgi:triacylglycerol lipase